MKWDWVYDLCSMLHIWLIGMSHGTMHYEYIYIYIQYWIRGKKKGKIHIIQRSIKKSNFGSVITAFSYPHIWDHNETEKNKMGVFYLTDYGAVKSVVVLTDIYIQYWIRGKKKGRLHKVQRCIKKSNFGSVITAFSYPEIRDHNETQKNRTCENYRLNYGKKLHDILVMIHDHCDLGATDYLA